MTGIAPYLESRESACGWLDSGIIDVKGVHEPSRLSAVDFGPGSFASGDEYARPAASE